MLVPAVGGTVLVLLVGVAVLGSLSGARDEAPTPAEPRDISAALADACLTLRTGEVARLGYAAPTARSSGASGPGLASSYCYRPVPIPPDEILPTGSLSVTVTTGRDYVDEAYREERDRYRIFREREIDGVPAVEVVYPRDPESCRTLVRVAEGQTVEVSVARAVPPPPEMLCALSSQAAGEVLANVPRR